MTPLTYLASPYTPIGESDDREQRFQAACKAAARLMLEGRVVFCPIAHSHPIEEHFPGRGAGPFWERQDAPYLQFCTELVVLMIPGWDKSSGVRHEIEVAQFRNIPISYIDP